MYYPDQRDVARNVYLPYKVDEQRNLIILWHDEPEEVELPLEWGVCPTCEGRGRHVNPSIDAHGISPEDFAEDPEFAEDYFRGTYDQPCSECRGRRVVPTSSDERFEEAVAEAFRGAYEDLRMRYYESGGVGW